MTLKELKIGESAVIKKVGGEGSLRQHFLDMGVIPGAELTMVKYAPMGDPIQLRIHGYELTLRLSDAEKIEIEPIRPKAEKKTHKSKHSVHPGLGEEGKYHPKGSGDPLPDKTKVIDISRCARFDILPLWAIRYMRRCRIRYVCFQANKKNILS